jgi:hypothetical protein
MTTRVIGKKSLTIKAKARKAESERLTAGRLELHLNQLISRARIFLSCRFLFVFSLLFYIFFHLPIYIPYVFRN